MNDQLTTLQQTVLEACAQSRPLAIVGGGSKSFYGREIVGEPLSTQAYQGVVSYEPTELVLTVRAGTPLVDVISLLDEQGQMLGFEPPVYSVGTTIGGAIASGLSGPIRPFSGSARDFVLGMKVLTGDGKIMSFGGQVMKNVAGFDVSRLMVGALGTLGVILDISLKVLPKPFAQMTLRLDQPDAGEAITQMNHLCGKPWPISALAWLDGAVWLRLSGTSQGIAHAHHHIGGDKIDQEDEFWRALNQQTHSFFQQSGQLIRASVSPDLPAVFGDGANVKAFDQIIDWGGALRWVHRPDLDEQEQRDQVQVVSTIEQCGGSATVFRGQDRQGDVFTQLSDAAMAIHKNLKNTFDPQGILNSGRLYAEL